jgi:hypothetical protein
VSSVVFLIAWLCLALLLLWPRRFLMVGGGILVAAMLVVNVEALYALTTPRVASAGTLLQEPVVGTLLTHRNFGAERGTPYTSFWDNDLYAPEMVERAITGPTTVMLLNFPPQDPDSPLRVWLQEQCAMTHAVVSRQVLIGERYLCLGVQSPDQE